MIGGWQAAAVGATLFTAATIAATGYRSSFLAERSLRLGLEADLRAAVRGVDALEVYAGDLEVELRHWRMVSAQLEGLEGATDHLNPYLRGVLDRVRSASGIPIGP